MWIDTSVKLCYYTNKCIDSCGLNALNKFGNSLKKNSNSINDFFLEIINFWKKKNQRPFIYRNNYFHFSFGDNLLLKTNIVFFLW
jgi:hypothetical protein